MTQDDLALGVRRHSRGQGAEQQGTVAFLPLGQTACGHAATGSGESGALAASGSTTEAFCATALHRIGIYIDADQAMVWRDSDEGKAARDRFLKR